MEHESVTVQIMLGGRSTRMGRDKALVELGGRTLLDRALDRWREYGAGVQLSVGNPERRAMAPKGMPAVADFYPDRGPLGGLHAGLRTCPTPLLLLTAVDCPFLTPALADGLLAAVGTADASSTPWTAGLSPCSACTGGPACRKRPGCWPWERISCGCCWTGWTRYICPRRTRIRSAT